MSPRRSRRNPKERLKSSFAALATVCVLIGVFGALIQIDSVDPGKIDREAARQIRARCNLQPDCTVRLADIVPGTWDTFYEFSPSVSKQEIAQVLGTSRVHPGQRQRVIVLTNAGKIVRRQYAHTGIGQPLAGELDFRAIYSGPHQGWVAYKPITVFRVSLCPTREGGSAFGNHGGTYYLLTPSSPTQDRASTCSLLTAEGVTGTSAHRTETPSANRSESP